MRPMCSRRWIINIWMWPNYSAPPLQYMNCVPLWQSVAHGANCQRNAPPPAMNEWEKRAARSSIRQHCVHYECPSDGNHADIITLSMCCCCCCCRGGPTHSFWIAIIPLCARRFAGREWWIRSICDAFGIANLCRGEIIQAIWFCDGNGGFTRMYVSLSKV